eukprot:scaffold33449_cov45-Phaeocystis_antarctica.AAC.2
MSPFSQKRLRWRCGRWRPVTVAVGAAERQTVSGPKPVSERVDCDHSSPTPPPPSSLPPSPPSPPPPWPSPPPLPPPTPPPPSPSPPPPSPSPSPPSPSPPPPSPCSPPPPSPSPPPPSPSPPPPSGATLRRVAVIARVPQVHTRRAGAPRAIARWVWGGGRWPCGAWRRRRPALRHWRRGCCAAQGKD